MTETRRGSISTSQKDESEDQTFSEENLSTSINNSELPRVIENEILSYLSVEDLSSAMLVARSWWRAANNRSLWLTAIKKDHSKKRLASILKANQYHGVRNYIYYDTHGYELEFSDSLENQPSANMLLIQKGENDSLTYSIQVSPDRLIRAEIPASLLQARLGMEYTHFRKALETREINKLKLFLPDILFIAFQNGHIRGKVDFSIQGQFDKTYSGDPAAGHFVDPTFLCIAANYISGKEGAKIISLLLFHNANLFASSHLHEWRSAFDPYGACPPIKNECNERPYQAASNKSIKAILKLAEFESSNHYTRYLYLIEACEHDDVFTREYVTKLYEARTPFKGIHKTYTSVELQNLHLEQDYVETKHTILEPGFIKRNYLWLSTAFLSVWFSICFSKATQLLGAKFVSIFTSLIAPTTFTFGIGLTVTGITCLGVVALAKYAHDYIYLSDRPHFPITFNPTPVPHLPHNHSTYAALFPRKGWTPSKQLKSSPPREVEEPNPVAPLPAPQMEALTLVPLSPRRSNR